MRACFITLAVVAFPAFAVQQYRPSAVISDFDNDLRPDFATAFEHGGRYQVQVHLTAFAQPRTFQLSAKSGGLSTTPNRSGIYIPNCATQAQLSTRATWRPARTTFSRSPKHAPAPLSPKCVNSLPE